MTTRMKKNRNKRVKVMLKSILKLFLALLWNILELLVYLIKLIIKLMYRLVFKFDSIVAKLFMKLPRMTRAVFIYILILNMVVNIQQVFFKQQYSFEKKYSNIETKSIKLNTVNAKKETCMFDEISCKIKEQAKELEMNEEEILISIAISQWETGNYTSRAFKEKNNIGGMMCNSGLIKYETLDDGIKAFLENLKYNYFNEGLTTIEKIQKKYCPIGAKNDPNGLNKNWIPGVTKKYEELKNNK